MPRQAVTSRAALCAAVVRLVDEQGLDAVSIRGVAAAEGVAIGTVQHHFASKDELLLAAYARVIEVAAARVGGSLGAATSSRERARSLMLELLPLDDARRAEARVALAFSVRSMHAAPLRTLYEQGYGLLCSTLTSVLDEAVAAGEAVPGVEPARDAVVLAALADGLAWHLLAAPGARRPGEAEAALEATLDRLLPAADDR